VRLERVLRFADCSEKPFLKNENTFGKSLLFVSIGNNGEACVQCVVGETVLERDVPIKFCFSIGSVSITGRGDCRTVGPEVMAGSRGYEEQRGELGTDRF
jgi:hypothetical protein